MRVGSSGSLQRVSIDLQRISRMPLLPGDNAQQVHSLRFLRQAYMEVSSN